MDINVTLLLCVLFGLAVSTVVIKIITITSKSRLDVAKFSETHIRLRARIAQARATMHPEARLRDTEPATVVVDELDEFLRQA